ncbi:hypothetical protein, partial [Beijerinckia sp. L45]|uniref:hypothetical protein n=1 Tax=Beijerinckia sp. L45 TaxID=1641855 RepID=UPI001AEE8ED6
MTLFLQSASRKSRLKRNGRPEPALLLLSMICDRRRRRGVAPSLTEKAGWVVLVAVGLRMG